MKTQQTREVQERRGERRKWSSKQPSGSEGKVGKTGDTNSPPARKYCGGATMQRHLQPQESRPQTPPNPRPARPRGPPALARSLSLAPLARALSPSQRVCLAGAATSVVALARTLSLAPPACPAPPYPACQAPVERPNCPDPVPLQPHSELSPRQRITRGALYYHCA